MCVPPAGVFVVLQFGAKFGAAFGKVMFAADAAAASSAADELTKALQWVEGELAKSEGPLFIGKELSLVRHTQPGWVLLLACSLHSYPVLLPLQSRAGCYTCVHQHVQQGQGV